MPVFMRSTRSPITLATLIALTLSVSAHADPPAVAPPLPADQAATHTIAGVSVVAGGAATGDGSSRATTGAVGIAGAGITNNSTFIGTGIILSVDGKLEVGAGGRSDGAPLATVDGRENITFGGPLFHSPVVFGGGLDLYGHEIAGFDSRFGVDVNPLALGVLLHKGPVTFYARGKVGMGISTDVGPAGEYGADARLYLGDRMALIGNVVRRAAADGGPGQLEFDGQALVRVLPRVALTADISKIEDLQDCSKTVVMGTAGIVITTDGRIKRSDQMSAD